MAKLGRGLSSLIPTDAKEHAQPQGNTQNEDATKALKGESDLPLTRSINTLRASEIRYIPLSKIHKGNAQPRRFFDDDELKGLAASIKEHGVLQPVLVRPKGDGSTNLYELIAGERRWRAARLVGIGTVPAIVAEIDDKKALEIAIVENVQRQNLLPLEEAEGYQRLMDEFSYSQDDVAFVMGKSRSNVGNLIRLLHLPETIKMMLNKNILSAGHARALLTSKQPLEIVEEVVSKQLSVRDTEKLVKKQNKKIGSNSARSVRTRDPRLDELEEIISDQLGGITCSISSVKGKGRFVVQYNSLDELEILLGHFNESL